MTLQETMVAYLESKGWYFDWDYIHEIWGDAWDPDEPNYESEDERPLGPTPDNQPDAIRRLVGWTLPQWGEYWSSDHLKPKGPKPKERRYESLQQAVWSQLLREEEPERFAVFYGDPKPEKAER